MTESQPLILGEFRRAVDDRHRISIPSELADQLLAESSDVILAKERPGALSVWSPAHWQERLQTGIQLVETKVRSGRLEGRLEEVQKLGRLLSTRHRTIAIAGRGRLLIPEGFREFLGVEPGSEVLLVGAAVCLEIWRPETWLQYLQDNMPGFGQLFDDLAG